VIGRGPRGHNQDSVSASSFLRTITDRSKPSAGTIRLHPRRC